ncbi:melanoma inhibitory activity protein 2-like [Periophthalmus magnuspinnatus]|uniref:melanoma inhibitory activity protein 2-like n=1 Tax=Periophthalmus magnuspinnatus TaxID=409849 RepID=UPI002436FCE5|nr:melanoma inhibitory activity protein 2-like [Periophthalmus magnuspinnatus]
MAASMLYRIIGLFLLNVIHFTSGLLSDYKICGDPECESRMSRVQALEDHYSKDCRFLSFRQGDIIFVYHKLTGKREDLWAGSIDRRFGYFPKAAVKEEEIYAKAEKVLETHQSDFFCLDENGYPIDTTEKENNAVTTDEVINPEVTQIMSPTLESPSQKLHETFVDTKTKSGQEEDGDNVESPNDQSGSSSWLRSSVTGLWGLVKKGDSSTNSEEDATKEMPELSVTSSVTGWLGFGAKHNGESGEELGTQDTQASSNLDSTMTGWLNFGSEVKEQDNTKSAQVDKPGEVFRSRKLALDFEDNQVHQEENKETGTLGWIGNGISSTLGFGSNNKDSGKGKSEETDKNLEPTSHSWFDVGITDMLGFRKDLAKENINRIEDLPVSEQNTDTLPNIPRLEQSKQLEIMEEKVVEIDSTNLNKDIKQSNDDYNLNTETNVVQRGSSNHNGPEIKPEHTEVELHTSDATSMEDSSKSVEFKDPKQLDEDTTISSNSKSTFDSQVIYDQDVHPLQLEHNVTEGKMDLLLENNADTQIDELAQNGSKFEISDTGLQMNEEESMQVEELHSSKVNEADSSEVNTNREVQDTLEDQKSHQEMPSTIKLINDIQDVFNDKKAMSEEVIETKQDVVDTDEPLNELKVKDDGDETLIEDELGQMKENGEQETNDKAEQKLELDVELNNNKEERESSGEMAQHKGNNLESVEDSHEEGKDELKGKRWKLDEETQVMYKGEEEEENPEEVALIQESSKTNLDTINGQQHENNNYFYEAEKEVKQQPAVEGNINIEENVDSVSLEELQEIVSNDDQVSKNSKESSLEESQNLKHTEQNVYEEINQSLFDLVEATKLVQQIADLDVKEENIDKLVNVSPKFTHDLNIDENDMTEVDSSSGNNKMEEETEEPTRTSDEIEEVFGLFNNTISFVTTTVNSEPTVETTTDEPQVSISNRMEEEDVKLINNSKDDSTVFSASQTTISQSFRETTLNPKTLHKLYSNILTYMNADEVMILIYSFGEHKLQFLDYILSNLDSVTSEHDADLSILLDIERLLTYHIETLMTSRIKTDSGVQEDKEKTRTLIALQKLEILLEKVKETFNFKTDLDNNEQDKDKEIIYEIMEETHGTGKVQAQDQRHDMEGVTNQILHILEKMATEALTQTHATLKFITWITVQLETFTSQLSSRLLHNIADIPCSGWVYDLTVQATSQATWQEALEIGYIPSFE